jgi:integrase
MNTNKTEVFLYHTRKPTKSNPRRKVWMLRWTVNGKRYGEIIEKEGREPETITKREAEAAQRDRQGKFDNNIVPAVKPERMTLIAFKTFHAEIAKAELSAGTMFAYDHAFAWAEKTIGADCLLESVNALHVAKIRNAMNDDKLAAGTIGKVMSYLRAAFSRAQVHKLIHENPFKGVVVKGATKPKDATIRTREEIAKLKTGAPDAWWRAAVGLWFCGLRMEEALSLQWVNVDFDGGKVHIRQSKAGTFKVGDKTFPILAWSAKTLNSYRTVPVPADTIAALRELSMQAGGSVYCFLSLVRLEQIQRAIEAGKWHANSQLVNNCLRDWQALQRRVLGDKVKLATIHDCRKAFATHAADLIPIQTLAEITGDTVGVLTRFYTKAKESHSDTLRQAFNDTPALKLAS